MNNNYVKRCVYDKCKLTSKEYKLAPVFMYSSFDPIAFRKAKIVYNFGLSECNRVNYSIC